MVQGPACFSDKQAVGAELQVSIIFEILCAM